MAQRLDDEIIIARNCTDRKVALNLCLLGPQALQRAQVRFVVSHA